MPATVSQTPSPRTPRAERTRQRILDAAGRCFAASGYAKTTVEAIALAAGVSKGLVYHHFGGKEELLEILLERTLADWDEASPVEAPAGQQNVLEALGEMHRTALAYARDNPLLRAIFQLDPLLLLDMRRSAAVRRALDGFREKLERMIRVGVASGELRPDLDVERAAEVVRILHLAFIDHLLNPVWVDAPDDALIEASLDVMCHGLARKEP